MSAQSLTTRVSDYMDMVLVTMRTCNFRTLRSNIFAKTIKFVKLFLPVHMGPMSNLLSKENGQKFCDTVPLLPHPIPITYTKLVFCFQLDK